jgi:hypothetical protein
MLSQVLLTRRLRREPYFSKHAVGELAGTTYTDNIYSVTCSLTETMQISSDWKDTK